MLGAVNGQMVHWWEFPSQNNFTKFGVNFDLESVDENEGGIILYNHLYITHPRMHL